MNLLFPMERFAALLRRQRAADPAPLRIYAERCGCSKSAVFAISIGDRELITVEMFVRLCQGHGLDPVATFTQLMTKEEV